MLAAKCQLATVEILGRDKAIFMRLVRIAPGKSWWWVVKLDRGVPVERVGSYPVWTGNKKSIGTGPPSTVVDY